jgi:hypothetical protein
MTLHDVVLHLQHAKTAILTAVDWWLVASSIINVALRLKPLHKWVEQAESTKLGAAAIGVVRSWGIDPVEGGHLLVTAINALAARRGLGFLLGAAAGAAGADGGQGGAPAPEAPPSTLPSAGLHAPAAPPPLPTPPDPVIAEILDDPFPPTPPAGGSNGGQPR